MAAKSAFKGVRGGARIVQFDRTRFLYPTFGDEKQAYGRVTVCRGIFLKPNIEPKLIYPVYLGAAIWLPTNDKNDRSWQFTKKIGRQWSELRAKLAMIGIPSISLIKLPQISQESYVRTNAIAHKLEDITSFVEQFSILAGQRNQNG